jgi:hypothetical protein
MQTYKKLMDSATESASKRAADELKIKNDAH